LWWCYTHVSHKDNEQCFIRAIVVPNDQFVTTLHEFSLKDAVFNARKNISFKQQATTENNNNNNNLYYPPDTEST
ncbi:MAG: hypothetical protein ABW185_20810, partial [Sedimenticola sp.]